MWCFLIACVILFHCQNAKTQGVYQYPERYDTNRRSYEVYPNNLAYRTSGGEYQNGGNARGAYLNYGNRRILHTADSTTYLSGVSANPAGGAFPSNVATGTKPANVSTGISYPLNGAISTPYQSNSNIAAGSTYPNIGGVGTPYQINRGTGAVNKVMNPSVISGAMYPNTFISTLFQRNSGTGVVNPNVATGAVLPNVGVGTPYQSNRGSGVVNTNIATGSAYPNSGVVGTPYQSNSGTGVINPNVATGVVNPNVATGAVYPNIGGVSTPYQSNPGISVVNPNVATGNVPNTGAVGTQYPGTGVTYPNNAAGLIIPSTNTVGQTYPQSSSNIGGLGSPNSNQNSGATGIFTSSSSQPQKVQLDVYYETNCPDSKRFITDQLTPLYRDFKDIIELRLVPFGKSQSWVDPITNQYQFRCQHGPDECYGNTVQGCAMSFYPDVETHLNFVDCMESYPRPSDNGLKCARRLSMDWNSISKCAEGNEGRRISNRNGELTKALQPRVTFVPWININKVHNDEIQRRSLWDLKSVLCEAYKAPHPKC